jgi:signal transduction histidine kinase
MRIGPGRMQLNVVPAPGRNRSELDDDIIDRFSKIAGIAVDRAEADAALQSRERELREAYAQLSEGQRLSKTGSFTSDIQKDGHRWSAEIYRIFEIDPLTPPGLDAIRARVHPDDLALYDAQILRGAEGSGADFDFRAITPHAGLKYLRGVAQLTHYIEGRPSFMGVVQDISEHKLAEDELIRARSELAHVARVTTLNAMAASIAHEVSQPVSGILTNANTCVRMLAADPPNLAGATETVKRTIRDANRATEVIKRLREMFSNKASTTEAIGLDELAREVIALSANELQRHRVLLQTEFSEELPLVEGDRVQLQQVILNLLLNAADAMASITDRPRTLLVKTDRHDDGSVRLAIRDSGIGLNPQAIGILFKAFYTTKAQGLGIGLSISRSIIERHAGRLWASVNDGPGATFTFCLPPINHDRQAAAWTSSQATVPNPRRRC